MNRNYRRYLVAGVSLGALSALPAGAATTSTVNCDLGAPAGCVQTPAADDTVDLTMIMSDAGNQEFYGQTTAGAGTINANVSTTANGEFLQQGTATTGDATLAITNSGTATIGAVAVGTGTTF